MTDPLHGGGEHTMVSESQSVRIGRYLLHRQIARGGMSTIHIARLLGDEGFSRIVVAKRLLPEFAEDIEFIMMFLDEARVASKVHHRNVVPVLDVVTAGGEAILVQEYVHGAPLHWLLRTARENKIRVPPDIAASIACQVLAGLHAAHETLDELGAPLNIVHRDVSPQNVMIATDGTARLLDFGVAKATMAAHVTREGQFKGKLAYSAPEQLRGQATRQSDLYSLSVLLWEILVGHRMHQYAQAEAELIATVVTGRLPAITQALGSERETFRSEHWRQLQAIEPVIKVGLSADLADRWTTAADMEQALIDVIRPASVGEVEAWLKSLGREFIDKHDRILAAEEASWRRVGSAMRRAVQIPSEVRSEASAPVAQLQPVAAPLPVAPHRHWGMPALVALLCSLIVALSIGIVIAVRGRSATAIEIDPAAVATPSVAVQAAHPIEGQGQPAATQPAATQPAATQPAAPVATTQPATVPGKAPTPTATPIDPTDTAETATLHPVIELQVGAPTTSAAATTNAGRSIRTSAATPAKKNPPVPPATIAPTPPAPVPTAAPAPAEPPADCKPPYYFEGQKKVFKPNCI